MIEFLAFAGIMAAIVVFISFVHTIITGVRHPGSVAKRLAKEEELLKKFGPIFPALVCPHCQTKGQIHAIPKKRKKGISGAKATGAILTFGFSMLATGLSRKETLTQAHCDNCDMTWDF